MADGQLILNDLPHEYGMRTAVDIFFRTLAATHGSCSTASQFFVLLAHVMKHSGNGSQPQQLGELAAHLADLKKSEALKASQALEIRKYLEQLNATQGDILKRLRTMPASPAGGDAWGKRLAWQIGIGLGLLLLGFLAGSLRSARQANDRLDAVIAAMPTAARASLYLEAHGGSISLGPINGADGHAAKGLL